MDPKDDTNATPRVAPGEPSRRAPNELNGQNVAEASVRAQAARTEDAREFPGDEAEALDWAERNAAQTAMRNAMQAASVGYPDTAAAVDAAEP